MSLEQYCNGKRVLVQNGDAKAYDVMRAAVANHVGAVLVHEQGRLAGIVTDRDLATRTMGADLDPHQTRLRDVMTPEPVTLPVDATHEQAAMLMRAYHVRRIPITDGGRAVGIVTLDDLLMTGAIDVDTAGDIVEAQLAEPAASKPAGYAHPVSLRSAYSGSSAAVSARSQAHARQTLSKFLARLEEVLGTSDSERALTTFNIITSALVRRVTLEAAAGFAAQLPASIRELLLDVKVGPDRSIGVEDIERELAEHLGISTEAASSMLRKLAAGLNRLVSPAAVAHLTDQLPKEMKALFQGG